MNERLGQAADRGLFAGLPAPVRPPAECVAALLRGQLEAAERSLSAAAWSLTGRPDALPAGSVLDISDLCAGIARLLRDVRD